jgi:Na+/H+ antiporter NhaD/arsenite permease-like protein
MPLLTNRPMCLASVLLLLLSVLAAPLLAVAADDSHDTPGEATHAMQAADGGEHGSEHAASGIGAELSLLWVIPFAGILLSIALGPIVNHHWWERNYSKVSLAWALAFAIPFCVVFGMRGEFGAAAYEILHIYFVDYIPFIIVLSGLFIVSGGIVLRGTLVGGPRLNVCLIAVGAFLASIIGTTGASMLLIHPLLRANRHRKQRTHIVIIFIFLVSNIGGSLTPLGDPPLFLGFLHGVPFQWTLSLLPQMLVVVALVLAIFYVMDRAYASRETGPAPANDGVTQSFAMAGAHNLVFLAGILGAVLLSGLWRPGAVDILGVHVSISGITRDLIIVAMALLAFRSTKQELRDENRFDWEPIREVGILFAGIFMTIIPALAVLRAGENGALAVVARAADSEGAYMWLTGILSSFLDNAPTYLAFFNTALGQLGLSEPVVAEYLRHAPLPWFNAAAADPRVVAEIQLHHPEVAAMAPEELAGNLELFVSYLKALSMGAVFMGANT